MSNRKQEAVGLKLSEEAETLYCKMSEMLTNRSTREFSSLQFAVHYIFYKHTLRFGHY